MGITRSAASQAIISSIEDGRLTIETLIDVLKRTMDVMDVQEDCNGEPFRSQNEELFSELLAIENLCRDASMTAGELLLPLK